MLELADVATDRLLGDEQAGRRPGEVELLRDRDEVPQRADVEIGVWDPADRIHASPMLVEREQVLDLGRCPGEA